MGCNKGEIELGFLDMSQVDIQTALRGLFPEDFSRQQQQQIDHQNNPLSSSSSSMRSLSTGSPEYSSLIFNNINPGTSSPSFPENTLPPMRPISNTPLQLQLQLQHQQLTHQITQTQFPTTTQIDHETIMRAIHNVLTLPSHHQNEQNNWPYGMHLEASGFGRYRGGDRSPNIGSNFRRQSLMKRSFAFFRSLNFIRLRERNQAATRPSNNQLHHMISERRRREKLNDNFHALRTLLPQGTKKDKASILITAKETLRSLMAEIDKLSKRNKDLMSQLQAKELSTTTTQEITKASNFSSNERLNVRVLHVPESSTSSLENQPMVDLQVNVMGQISQVDILIRLLEFLKQVQHVNLVSIDATNTNNAQVNSIHQLTFRLMITQGSEWDEGAFQEAVRRVVADFIQYVDQNL
ncbi:putative transcription factor bHLH041 isoform X2 [Cicer arietinum]